MRAADILGINRNTLRRKMVEHGVEPRWNATRRG
jgi:DNA-binding protein Fis